MHDNRGRRGAGQQRAVTKRVVVLVVEQRDAGPASGQRPDVQRPPIGEPGAVGRGGDAADRRDCAGIAELGALRVSQGLHDLGDGPPALEQLVHVGRDDWCEPVVQQQFRQQHVHVEPPVAVLERVRDVQRPHGPRDRGEPGVDVGAGDLQLGPVLVEDVVDQAGNIRAGVVGRDGARHVVVAHAAAAHHRAGERDRPGTALGDGVPQIHHQRPPADPVPEHVRGDLRVADGEAGGPGPSAAVGATGPVQVTAQRLGDRLVHPLVVRRAEGGAGDVRVVEELVVGVDHAALEAGGLVVVVQRTRILGKVPGGFGVMTRVEIETPPLVGGHHLRQHPRPPRRRPQQHSCFRRRLRAFQRGDDVVDGPAALEKLVHVRRDDRPETVVQQQFWQQHVNVEPPVTVLERVGDVQGPHGAGDRGELGVGVRAGVVQLSPVLVKDLVDQRWCVGPAVVGGDGAGHVVVAHAAATHHRAGERDRAGAALADGLAQVHHQRPVTDAVLEDVRADLGVTYREAGRLGEVAAGAAGPVQRLVEVLGDRLVHLLVGVGVKVVAGDVRVVEELVVGVDHAALEAWGLVVVVQRSRVVGELGLSFSVVLRVQVELPPLGFGHDLEQQRRCAEVRGQLDALGGRRAGGGGTDAVERALVVDDVPALVVDRVRGVELPGLAVGGEDPGGCAVRADGDVRFGSQHVALVGLGELVREAAGQRAGVAGNQGNRGAGVAGDGAELLRCEGDSCGRTVGIAHWGVHHVACAMHHDRPGVSRREQRPVAQRVPILIGQQTNAGPIAGQRPDIQRLAVCQPRALRSRCQGSHRLCRRARTERDRGSGQLEKRLGDLVTLRSSGLGKDPIEVRRLLTAGVRGERVDRVRNRRHRPRVRPDRVQRGLQIGDVLIPHAGELAVQPIQQLRGQRNIKPKVIQPYVRRSAVLRNGVLQRGVIRERLTQPVNFVESQPPLAVRQSAQAAQHVAGCVHLRVIVERWVLTQVEHRLAFGGNGPLRLIELLDRPRVRVRITGRRESGDIGSHARPLEMLAQVDERPFNDLGKVCGVGTFQHRRKGSLLVQVIEHRLGNVARAQNEDVARLQIRDFVCGIGIAGVRVVDAGGILGQARVAEQQHHGRLAHIGGLNAGGKLTRCRQFGGEVSSVQTVDRHYLDIAVHQRVEGVDNVRIAKLVDLGARAGVRHRVAVQRVGADRQRSLRNRAVRPAFHQHPLAQLPGKRLHDQRLVDAEIVQELPLLSGVADTINCRYEHSWRAPVAVEQPGPRIGGPRLELGPDVKAQVLLLRVGVKAARRHPIERLARTRGNNDLDRPVIALQPHRINEVHPRRNMPGVRSLIDVNSQIGLPRIVKEPPNLLLNDCRIGQACAQSDAFARSCPRIAGRAGLDLLLIVVGEVNAFVDGGFCRGCAYWLIALLVGLVVVVGQVDALVGEVALHLLLGRWGFDGFALGGRQVDTLGHFHADRGRRCRRRVDSRLLSWGDVACSRHRRCCFAAVVLRGRLGSKALRLLLSLSLLRILRRGGRVRRLSSRVLWLCGRVLRRGGRARRLSGRALSRGR